MPNIRSDRPTQPWRPSSVTVFPVKRTKTRPRSGPAKTAWLLRWRVDGLEFWKQFANAADAQAWAKNLVVGDGKDWYFDPRARRFRAPSEEPASSVPDTPEVGTPPPPVAVEAITVFELTERYWARKWPSLEPKGREELARYLNRLRRYFVTEKPSRAEAAGLDMYLHTLSLSVRTTPAADSKVQLGEDWLRSHSTPVAGIGRPELEAFLAHHRPSQRDPSRQVSPASERRMAADLRQVWAWAVRTELLADNPWDRVELRTRDTGRRARTGSAALSADAEVVLSPDQVRQLACCCVFAGSWDGRVLCFVLVMGLCGLRPSEAIGVVVGDLDLPPSGTGWLTARRNHRRASGRYLDEEEDEDWGPLKGRGLDESRRVPVPEELVRLLREHLRLFCPGAGPADLVFHRRGRPFNLEVFGRQVWAPARSAMFPLRPDLAADSPLQPKLARLRRHDLRHSACSTWLRAGVDVSVCQRWSGHKRLSVFLDVYQGLIPGREEAGARMVEAHLDHRG